ncbi:ABC transporter ATP-binding protein [Williamsia serinedens]|uniref:Peptide/nickel transport system ATP-binding protein n=1 Tax=Williamsia serinedens TaxID=391736 RepID=A0ABT1H4F0_9NOCA|nr:ABC transporter ATP-binding protein [Williamsia serinedens]MCP2161844.1 peptide/nickel transport system ATP-binding protein [Williamsia serinedens]
MTDDTPVLAVSDLQVTFPSEEGTVTAVRGLDYQVARGEVLAIVGESGSGKSVSSLAVMGLLPDTARVSGSIELNGRQLLGLSDREMSSERGRTVAMISQDPLTALTPIYRVGDQIAEALRIHQPDLSRADAQDRAVELLETVGIPDARSRSRSYPHEFSGGMRQRVVIAMAIANDPDLIIADEPTTALDVTVQAQVLDLLRTARDVTGAAVVFITHDLGVVAGVADRVMVMYAGRAVETAPVDVLFDEPAMPYTVGLLGSIPRPDRPAQRRLIPIEGTPPALVDMPTGCPFAPRCPMHVDACDATEPPLAEVTPGHRAACIRADTAVERSAAEVFDVDDTTGAAEPDSSEVVLSVRDLHKSYPLFRGSVLRRRAGTFAAVKGVSFDVRAGSTLAIVGESGCGKSTTLLQIMDFARPEQGSVEIRGQRPYELSRADQRALRAHIQIVFQDPMASLDPRIPVGEIIAEPLRIRGADAGERARRVRELMDTVGLRPALADRYPAQFSGGQRQRVGIARALATKPSILVLDEPVSALDVSIQAGVLNLLQDLQAELGLAYLFVSHDLGVVRHLADEVAVMRDGVFVEKGPTETVFSAPRDTYTKALLAAIPIPDPARQRERITEAAELAQQI